ncbi:pyridoxamine 5'-phosphate oxidase family protein [Streptomyces sp. NBC_00019]
MSTEEWHAFVTLGAPTGRFATVGADGTPNITPVWYVFDGEAFPFTTGGATAKARNLRRNPRAEEFGRRNAVPGELVVRLHPTKVIAHGGVTD